jgi:hypothetical protein
MRGKDVYVAIQGSWRKAGEVIRVAPHPHVFVSYRTLAEVIHDHHTLADAKKAHHAWWAMSIDVLELLLRKEIAYTNIVVPKSPRKIYSAQLHKWHEFGISWSRDPEGRIRLLSFEYFVVRAGREGDRDVDPWY